MHFFLQEGNGVKILFSAKQKNYNFSKTKDMDGELRPSPLRLALGHNPPNDWLLTASQPAKLICICVYNLIICYECLFCLLKS